MYQRREATMYPRGKAMVYPRRQATMYPGRGSMIYPRGVPMIHPRYDMQQQHKMVKLAQGASKNQPVKLAIPVILNKTINIKIDYDSKKAKK